MESHLMNSSLSLSLSRNGDTVEIGTSPVSWIALTDMVTSLCANPIFQFKNIYVNAFYVNSMLMALKGFTLTVFMASGQQVSKGNFKYRSWVFSF